MKIAVFGTGAVGQALAGRLSELGHTVAMGTRDIAVTRARTTPGQMGSPGAGAWLQEHPEISLLTYAEAAAFADRVIVHAMNGHAAIESLKAANAKDLEGKVLLDISNPLDFSQGFPPSLFVNNTDSLGEQIQAAFPQLQVVKTLNTMSNPVMVHPELVPGDHTVFLSGNDAAAKQEVAALLKQFGWAERNMLDLGDITTARGTEMLLPVWVRIFAKTQTPMFNFHINFAPKAG